MTETEPISPASDEDTELLQFDKVFNQEVMASIRDLGWETPSPVQDEAIPLMLEGKDLIVEARTGSGKTGAFGLPIVSKLDPTNNNTQALIMLPTRELASQLAVELGIMGKHRGLRCVPIYGGVGYQEQLDGIKAGAHIIAGTPGRILDHVSKGALHFQDLSVLILDEADELLSQGFWPDMKELHSLLPAKRQSCMFSATMPEKVLSLGRVFLNDPVSISLSKGQMAPAQIRHLKVFAKAAEKAATLLRVLEAEEPDSAIVFANTRGDVRYVTGYLKRNGWDAGQISGDLSQADRERAMNQMKAGKLRILVATDVAARGIDISDLSHVISYSTPDNPDVYVHRTGRTGRAGKAGTAISIISGLDIGNFRQMQLVNKIKVEDYKLPTPEKLSGRLAQKLSIKIKQETRHLPEEELTEKIERFLAAVDTMIQDPEGRRELAAICMTFLIEHRPVTTVEDPPPAPANSPSEEKPRPRRNEERGGRAGGRRKPGGSRRNRPPRS